MLSFWPELGQIAYSQYSKWITELGSPLSSGSFGILNITASLLASIQASGFCSIHQQIRLAVVFVGHLSSSGAIRLSRCPPAVPALFSSSPLDGRFRDFPWFGIYVLVAGLKGLQIFFYPGLSGFGGASTCVWCQSSAFQAFGDTVTLSLFSQYYFSISFYDFPTNYHSIRWYGARFSSF